MDTPLVRVITLSDGNGAIAATEEGGPVMLELPYPRNNLRIELAILEFTAPERNRYKWRMLGYRDAWTTAAATVPIELNNVPPGAFTLEVVGINGDGVEGPLTSMLAIGVARPFWAAPWFIALVSAAVIAAIAWLWALAYRSGWKHGCARRNGR
ncbi:MAG: triple tyrosine motif-containing protein [Flavobacteriales bacterium]